MVVRKFLSRLLLALLIILCRNVRADTDIGPDYPRLSNIYLAGSVDPSIYDSLSKWDLVVVDSVWTDAELQQLRNRNPNIRILSYVCAYCVISPPYSGNPWAVTNYNYAQTNNLWWYNRLGTIASDWAGTRMLNITSSTAGPQGTWRQYIAQRVEDLMVTRPNFDGVFFDNYWQSLSWEQNTIQVDSDRDGFMDGDTDHDGVLEPSDDASALDIPWSNALTALAQDVRNRFNTVQIGRPRPLVIMGNGASSYFQNLNGAMYENFPKITGIVEGGNPYQYAWNYSMFHSPGGYSIAPFSTTPLRTMVVNAMWNRVGAAGTGPNRTADFERHKRFTFVSALLGDGYYSLDGALSGGHGDLWWEPEYDHGGLKKGYLGQAHGAMYRVAAPTGPELIANGSFSSGTTSWNWQAPPGNPAPAAGTFGFDSIDYHSAPQAAKFVVSPASVANAMKLWQSPVSVVAGRAYTFRFWAKASAPQELLLDLYCVPTYCMPDQRFQLTTSWAEYSVSYTAPAGGASGLNIFIQAPGTVWLDDVSFREGDTNVFRRDFDKGSVLLNYSNTDRIIPLGANYRRLQIPGSSVWDGATVTSETVPKYDARILFDVTAPSAPSSMGIRVLP